MEFDQVVRRRRMVRRFDPAVGVSRETVRDLLALAVQAPSAGFSQGWHFLVLADRADVELYWQVTAPPGEPDAWLRGLRTAPVLVVVLAEPERYRARYARADKQVSPAATTGTGDAGADLDHWPVPWWDVDAGIAGLLVLLGAVDRGLGGCLAGVPAARWDAVRAAFAVPAGHRPVALLALGHPAPDAGRRPRARRPVAETVSIGRFGRPDALPGTPTAPEPPTGG